MLTGKYRRIYHHHLAKCGGSTLNQWLDTLTSDDRIYVDAWTGLWRVGNRYPTRPARAAAAARVGRSLFYWSDVVHSHGPLRQYAPPNTFCFTMLRDPVQRLVSQVSDWRRLGPNDTINHEQQHRVCVENAKRLPLGDFLERHGRVGHARIFLDNYMTRALATARMGAVALMILDAERLLEIALQALENEYDLIGLTERFDLSRNAFCAMAGLPPAKRIPTVNVTRKIGEPDSEMVAAHDILKSLNSVDQIIYDRACTLFDRRHRATGEAYDTATFETQYAAALLSETRGIQHGGASRYSVRQPLIGSGFHGRDGAGLPTCAVWTGPERCTTLYIPTPPNLLMSLLVWIRGYADGRQREQLRVRVDGAPVAHRFSAADGYADLLEIDTVSDGPFVRLELEIDETVVTGEPGSELYDPRERGIAFDSYGWRPA